MKRKNKEQMGEALDDAVMSEAVEEKAEEAPSSPEEEKEAKNERRGDIKADVALLKELFPDLSADDIPKSVWEEVQNGQSLAGSYALYFIKKIKEDIEIRTVNERNSKKAPPKVNTDGNEKNYFSPDAVRKMSAKDVRKNYDAIIRSMDSWK